MKSTCSCGCENNPCATAILERPRYFDRQIITSTEMNLASQYLRDCQRRHNRLLHGWGVVCGARVCPVIEDGEVLPWVVEVGGGYILAPHGEEIVIDCPRRYDLRTGSTSGVTGDSCAQPPDPWCSDVYTPRDAKGCLYVAVRYREFPSRPVRVPLIGCGCEESQCEYSRVRDGYEISALEQCPTSHCRPDSGSMMQTRTTAAPVDPIKDWMARKPWLRECPPCPPEPWVVLAKVCFESDGTITLVDNCDCRRIVVSFADFWFSCRSETVVIKEAGPASPNQPLVPGAQGVQVIVGGSGFEQGATVILEEGFTVHDVVVNANGDQITFTVDIAADVSPGDYRITVKNPDCSLAVGTITVQDDGTQPPHVGRVRVAKKRKK